VKRPVCCICEDASEPAPHPHPIDPTLRLCRACREDMQFAEDLASRQGEDRIGDTGRRAAIMAGRVVKGVN
jgi:hypothetical protein